MKTKCLEDTDTTHMEFSDQPVEETGGINENIYINLDSAGNLVGMTIEHAATEKISWSWYSSTLLAVEAVGEGIIEEMRLLLTETNQ